MKKTISVVLAVIIFVSVMHINAFAKTQNNPTQKVANIILFGYFQDDTQEGANDFFAQKTADIIRIFDGSNGRSFKNYIDSISYGQLQIDNVLPQYDGNTIVPVMIPVSESDANSRDCDYSIVQSLVNSTPSIADKTVDYDNDGLVDNVMLVVRTKNTDSGAAGSSLISHKAVYPGTDTINNKKVSMYNIISTNSLFQDETGVVAHEFLHTLGYGDLYRSYNDERPVYLWSIMGATIPYPQYPLAFERMYFTNWITIDTITEDAALTLDMQSEKDGNQAFILKSPFNDREIFVIEYRVKPPINYSDKDSLDYKIGGSGVIVYRVNPDVDRLSNLDPNKTGIYIFRPQNGMPGYTGNDQTDSYNAYLPYEDRNSIGSSDLSKTLQDGALTYCDGTNSGIVISDITISSDGKTATCNVSIPKAEDYDVWNDTNCNILTSDNEVVSMVSANDEIYMMNYQNKNFTFSKFDGVQWTFFANEIAVDSFASNPMIIRCGDYLYLSFTSMASGLYLYRYDLLSGGNWQNIVNKSDAYYDCTIMSLNNELYTAYISDYQYDWNNFNNSKTVINIAKLNGNSLQTVNTLTCGLVSVFKLCEYDNSILLTCLDSSKNQVFAKKIDGNNVYDLGGPTDTCTNFDVITKDSVIYISIPGNNTKIATYLNNTWCVDEGNGEESYESKFSFLNNKLYLLTSPQSGNSGNLKMYSYENGDYLQCGENIDTVAKSISSATLGNTFYAGYVRDGDGKVLVKSKTITSTASDENYDLNGDCIVNSNDYAMIREYAYCKCSMTQEQKIKADFNSDGAVDAFDAVIIDNYLNS